MFDLFTSRKLRFDWPEERKLQAVFINRSVHSNLGIKTENDQYFYFSKPRGFSLAIFLYNSAFENDYCD